MSAEDNLGAFVRDAYRAGHDRARIETALGRAGWDEAQRAAALDRWLIEEGMPPIPRAPERIVVRNAVMNALLLVSLGMVAWHICQLGFALIDQAFRPAAAIAYFPDYNSEIRWSIAALVAFVPLMLILSSRLAREPRGVRSSDRRISAALTLILVSIVLLGDFVFVVYELLTGDLTIRFILKALLVAVVALLVLWFYREELDGKP
ncbi:MAG: DUF5671 domain-containing protein [Paracoccus sp. (in: a-proteobacteria)]|nr:DUF5671 domain-containing protein [Paracoccus sp. (in: a-proteobacteria)]